MRGLKKMALLGALMMIFSSAAVQVNRVSTDSSVIKNAAAEVAALENDKELTVENMSSFNGIRVSVTGQVESDAKEDAYARRTVLYAGLGEGDRDLTNAESLSVQLKFVTTYSARLFVVLADGKGNTAVSKFFANRPNDGQPLGSKFYDESGAEVSLTEASGSAWEGVTVKTAGTAGVLVCAKSGFYTAEAMWNDNSAGAQTNKNEYGIADKTVTPDGTFNWRDVRRVMISFTTWNVNTVDVGNISAKYAGGEEKILFDAAESERKPATKIATLGKDEWAFAPRLNYIENWLSDKGGVFENLGKESATITAARVKKNGFVFGRKSAAKAENIWTKVSTPDGANYGDITAYDAFSFDLDAETLTQNGQIDFILRVNSGTEEKDYRANGNGADSSNYFHYIDGEGKLTTNSSREIGGNIIPQGFKGSYMIPMNAFQGTSVDDHPTQDELKNTVALFMVFIGAQYKGSETVSISNVKLIDDFAAQIPLYQVNNELSSLTGKVTEKNFAAQKALVEKAESGYNGLTPQLKARVENYERLAAAKSSIAGVQKTKMSATAQDFAESFAMTDGAALRVKKDDYGLRFQVNLDEAAYAALKTAANDAGAQIKLGAILAATDSLNGAELTKENAQMALTVGKWNVENKSFYATLGCNAIKGKESVAFTVRGYVTITYVDGSTQTIYTEYTMPKGGEALEKGGAISRSLTQVAEAVNEADNFEKEFGGKSEEGKAYAREVLAQILSKNS